MIMMLDRRMEAGFQALNQRIDNLEERVGVLERTTSKLVLKVEDMWDWMNGLQDTSNDHERRIKKLEKQTA